MGTPSPIMRSVIFFALAASATASFAPQGGDIVIEDFSSPSHHWVEQNDPVMGGQSTGTFTIKSGVGHFDGVVKDVPFLHAPGFIKVTSDESQSAKSPDVSHCDGVALTILTNNSYSGFHFSFGNAHAPGAKFFAYGYKASFVAPTKGFSTVVLPFTSFSDYWDDATGKDIKTCADDPKYCPSKEWLQDMKTMSFWGEGVNGEVFLQIKSIAATGCK